jgi:hypothetical protein
MEQERERRRKVGDRRGNREGTKDHGRLKRGERICNKRRWKRMRNKRRQSTERKDTGRGGKATTERETG